MSLQLSDVRFAYSHGTGFATPALTDVNLRIDRGQLTLVLGATGSGKSTLLRIAAGLLAPDAGSVTLESTVVTGSLADTDPGVGLVFQSPEMQLFAESVLSDVAFGPMNLGMAEADAHREARAALSMVGLDGEVFEERSPFSLSGGEARRVAIAGVLAMRPGYLLLDEPTAGLDPAGRVAVRELVASVRGDTGVVVVTHDAEEFLPIADRAVLLAEGRIAYSGPADDLIRAPGVFAEVGLRPPEVLRAQMLASEKGLPIRCSSLDPGAAAAALLAAREAAR